MISEAEVRRNAAAIHVDPMVTDLDYSLGWFLLGMRKTKDSLGVMKFFSGVMMYSLFDFGNLRAHHDSTSKNVDCIPE